MLVVHKGLVMLHSSKRLSLSIGGPGLSLHEKATGPREDAAVRMDLNTDELQFAGVLLRSVEKLVGKPIILFAALEGASKPLNSIRRVAAAVRQIGGSKVALVRFPAGGRESLSAATLDVPELKELRHWIAEGTANAAEIRWTGANDDGTGIVPTLEVVHVFERLKEIYDVICVDAGDVFSSSNALATAPYCSGVVLMVERDVTAVRDVEHAQKMLLQAGARVLGFAFTKRG
jgi:hypothetical protein